MCTRRVVNSPTHLDDCEDCVEARACVGPHSPGVRHVQQHRRCHSRQHRWRHVGAVGVDACLRGRRVGSGNDEQPWGAAHKVVHVLSRNLTDYQDSLVRLEKAKMSDESAVHLLAITMRVLGKKKPGAMVGLGQYDYLVHDSPRASGEIVCY
jgi:hypothetical protein